MTEISDEQWSACSNKAQRLSCRDTVMLRLFVFTFALQSACAAVSFRAEVSPILLEKCVACHGAEKQKGGLRLDTFAALEKGGDSKKALVRAGAPEESLLYQLITTSDEDDRMPQKADRLADSQIMAIRAWIAEGAKFDGTSPDQTLAALVPYQPGPEPLAHYPFPQPILALAWSADGHQLASSGYHEALVWDDAGQLRHRVSRLPQRIHGLAFLEDGNTLAVAAGTPGKSGEILLCRMGSAETPRLLARLPDVVVALAINKDRTRLAAGGADNAIRVFELPSGKELYSAQQHADWVTSLAFSPDGTRIASASRDRTARVFDAAKGDLLETYPEHAQPLFAVAFSADGKRVFSGGREKKVHAWQAHEAKKSGEFPALEGDVLGINVAGGRVYVCGADKTIREFNANDRKQVRTLAGHQDWVYALAFHDGSNRLASGSYDGEIRIWNAETGQSITAFKGLP